MLVVLICLALFALGVYLYFRFFKLYKMKSVVFVDGAPGTGKSFLCVALAVRRYKQNLFRWKVACKVCKALSFLPAAKRSYNSIKDEQPMLYSNMNLRCVQFVKVTRDLLFRQNYRFAYNSVILLDEFSLVADQMCYKDREMSERLSLFFKLVRHECGNRAVCVINSQSTSDLHYSVKYVLSDYLYIHHSKKYPFMRVLKVQEMFYQADKDGQSAIAVHNGDVEDSCKAMCVLSKYYKYYDSRCYSIFTDGLPVYKVARFNAKGEYIKDCELVSFKEYRYLYENIRKQEKKHVAPQTNPTNN